nr:hypothetical protein CFP56_17562 [Quercus suber]
MGDKTGLISKCPPCAWCNYGRQVIMGNCMVQLLLVIALDLNSYHLNNARKSIDTSSLDKLCQQLFAGVFLKAQRTGKLHMHKRGTRSWSPPKHGKSQSPVGEEEGKAKQGKRSKQKPGMADIGAKENPTVHETCNNDKSIESATATKLTEVNAENKGVKMGVTEVLGINWGTRSWSPPKHGKSQSPVGEEEGKVKQGERSKQQPGMTDIGAKENPTVQETCNNDKSVESATVTELTKVNAENKGVKMGVTEVLGINCGVIKTGISSTTEEEL